MVSLFSELEISSRVYTYCDENGQCEELELLFACKAQTAYVYALDIIEKRFEFGEEIIYKDLSFRRNYKTFFKLD